MPDAPPEVDTVISQPFAENSYLLCRAGLAECLVFDPGLEPTKIIDLVEQRGLRPAAILCTHGHWDHIAGNEALLQRWPDCPLVIGHGDADKLTDPVGNLSAGYGIPCVSPAADQTVGEGDVFEAAGFRFDVVQTPGHSSGHVTFIDRQSSPVRVFSGDVLFQGGIGRYDFPDSSYDDLQHSVQHKLFLLPDDAIVYTGHGPTTTIGAEKRYNPFLGAAAGFDV